MRKRKMNIDLLIILLAFSLNAASQGTRGKNDTDSLFAVVETKNTVLESARRQAEAARLKAGTGITPEDPVVEFGYLAGNPSSIGNRLDFSVTQNFDFPTVYFRMAGVKEIKEDQALLIYEMTRQHILTEARKLRIERIHLNRMEKLLSTRLNKAVELKNQYRKMLEAGEVGKLSLSQVNLQLSVLKADMEEVQSDIRSNREQFHEITGGDGFEISTSQYPLTGMPGRDSLELAYANSPEARFYAMETDLKESQKKVAVSKALPKFSAGYYSETVIDESYRGVSLGISVPIWSNKNKVKLARVEIDVAKAEADWFKLKQQTDLENNLERWSSLNLKIDELTGVLSETDNMELLGIALEVGEISLSEYIYSTEFYLQNVRRLMEYERDLRLAEADIMKVLL